MNIKIDMLFLELVLQVPLVVYFVMKILKKGHYKLLNLILISSELFLLGIYSLFYESRWQVKSAFFACVILLFVELLLKKKIYENKKGLLLNIIMKLIHIIIISMVFISALSSVVLQPIKYPEPTGDYSIGRTDILLLDETRYEVYTKDNDDKREVLVHVWYPAEKRDNSDDVVEKMWGSQLPIDAMSITYGVLPPVVLSHLEDIDTNSIFGLEVNSAEDTYPVLVFSHGSGLFAHQNSIQFEDLASHGYIVMSISHLYDSGGVTLPDGTTITQNIVERNAHIDQSELENPELDKIYSKIFKSKDKDVREKLMIEMHNLEAKDRLNNETLDLWVEDTIFVIDQLEKINKTHSILKNKIDFDKIGAFGMSLGGATAGAASIIDDRIKCAVNLDGTQFRGLQGDVFDKPIMFITTDNGLYDNNIPVYKRAIGPKYYITIKETLHTDLTDIPIVAPLITGKLDNDITFNSYITYTRVFFDYYLKGIDSILLNPDQVLNDKVDIYNGL